MQRVGRAYADRLVGLRDDERRMFDEQAEIGIVSGLTIPRWAKIGEEEVASGFALWTAEEADVFDLLLECHGSGIAAFLFSVEDRFTSAVMAEAKGWTALTPRERECLTLTAMGMRMCEIAYRLSIAEVTVNVHLRSARKRLQARTLPEAVAKALGAGLIAP